MSAMGMALVKRDGDSTDEIDRDVPSASADVPTDAASSSEEDAVLLARVRDGDETAFATLVTNHYGNVYGLACRMLHDQSEAEDISQDVFLKVWNKPEAWNPDGARFSTWLYRVTANACIDRMRKKVPHPTDFIPETPDPAAGADTRLFEDQVSVKVDAAIANLPERQRLALVATYYQGLTNKEAAIVLGVTVDALESLLARARRKLKQDLKSEWRALIADGIDE